MKKAMILVAMLIGCGGAPVDDTPERVAMSGFVPTPGLYNPVKELGPTEDNPNACVFANAEAFVPDKIIGEVQEDGSYEEKDVVYGDESVFLQCSFTGEGRGISCTGPEQIVPFGLLFGFGDATMIIGEQSVSGAWMSPTSFRQIYAATYTVDCVGADCDILQAILGLNHWGCDKIASHFVYAMP